MPSDNDEPDWQDWQNQKAVVWSGGVAVLILVAILIFAVMRTSDSSKTPETVPIPTSSITPSTYTTSSTTTTSYTVPPLQTSEDSPPLGPGPTVDPPTPQSR